MVAVRKRNYRYTVIAHCSCCFATQLAFATRCHLGTLYQKIRKSTECHDCWRSIRGSTIQDHLATPQKHGKYWILVKWFKCEIDRHLPLDWCWCGSKLFPPHWIWANKTVNGAAISHPCIVRSSQFYFHSLDYLMHSNCSHSPESDSCLAHDFCVPFNACTGTLWTRIHFVDVIRNFLECRLPCFIEIGSFSNTFGRIKMPFPTFTVF